MPTSRSTFVALDQLVGVLGGLGRIGFVIHREVLDLAATELAALLRHVLLEAVGDGIAQRRVGTGCRAASGRSNRSGPAALCRGGAGPSAAGPRPRRCAGAPTSRDAGLRQSFSLWSPP